jgi:hypothetical protein
VIRCSGATLARILGELKDVDLDASRGTARAGARREEASVADQRYKKLTINLTPEFHEELSALAEERGITITDLIKRAIALDKYVWEHRNGELLLKEDDTIRQIVLIRA